MFTPENPSTKPTRETSITLVELIHLVQVLENKHDSFPSHSNFDAARAFNKNLANALFSVWQYWSKRTDDTSRFTLTIKK